MTITLPRRRLRPPRSPFGQFAPAVSLLLPAALLGLTSHLATREYASQALNVVGIPDPRVFIAAQDVQKGKPQ